jgi:hypothetical protein
VEDAGSSASEDADEADAEPEDSTTAMTEDTTPAEVPDGQVPDRIVEIAQSLDEDTTLNEALDECPVLKEYAEDALGEKMLAMAKKMHGDTPVVDLPFDQFIPDEMDVGGMGSVAVEDLTEDVDEDESWTGTSFGADTSESNFEFEGDPLSQDDDE